MMNTFAIVLVIALVVAGVSSFPEKYSNKYDHIDIDSVLKNERVLMSYVNCILEKGPCTQEGRDFRKHLPDALATSCQKCTESQKKLVKKAARHLMNKKKNEWEQIRAKYDPNGEHTEKFSKFMQES